MIGERVRHARIYHGWSQTKLAEQVGVKQPAISLIENGGPASEETLAAIARETQFAPWFFRLGPLPDLPQGSLRFRKRATSRVREDERVRAHVRQTVEILTRLEQKVKPPPVRINPIKATSPLSDDEIEHMASTAREWLGIGPDDPIPNVIRAIERAGVAVVGSVHEIEKHFGASYWPDFPDGRPIICFTRGMPGDRERLTVCHELGHLILHHLRDVDSDVAEAEAYQFAGALLLPRHVALDMIKPPVTLQSLARVKARVGMSISSLVRRCLDLRLIDKDRRTSLEKQISARGWRKEEPVTVEEERPRLVRQVIEAAMGANRPHQLAAALGLPPLAIRELVA